MIGSIINGIGNAVGGYFKGKAEVKKAKIAAELVEIEAKAKERLVEVELKSSLAKNGQKYDYDLDRIATENMKTSYKDDIAFYLFLLPLGLSFHPETQAYVANGFAALQGVPEWYMYMLGGMMIVTFGMRGMFKQFMQGKQGLSLSKKTSLPVQVTETVPSKQLTVPKVGREIKRIVVHCSDSTFGSKDIIKGWHVNDNGWSDIGYHYVVNNGTKGTEDGEIEEGRPLSKAGAHVRGHNNDTVGICLVGKKEFTEAQFDSLKELIERLQKVYGIKDKDVVGHKDLDKGKTCPNFDVKSFIANV